MLAKYQGKVAELKEYAKKTCGLDTAIRSNKYPFAIVFMSGKHGQMSLFDNVETEAENGEKKIVLVFTDKMSMKTSGDITISEEAFNKLKNLSKEVNRLYLNAFCQHVLEYFPDAAPINAEAFPDEDEQSSDKVKVIDINDIPSGALATTN